MVYSFFVSLICVFFFQPGYYLSAGLLLSWKALASPGPFSEKQVGLRFTLVTARHMSSSLRRNCYNNRERMEENSK